MSATDVLNVFLISTSYPSSHADWKGVFIRNMVEAIARKKAINLAVWQPPGPVPDGVAKTMSNNDERWFRGLLAKGGIAHVLRRNPPLGLFKSAQLLQKITKATARQNDVDIWHVNWLQNALAVPSDSKPLIVSALGSDLALLKLPWVAKLLRKSFKSRTTIICPNSRWMVTELQKYFGDIAEIRYLPFGIDEPWYQVNRDSANNVHWLCITRVTEQKLGKLFDWGKNVFSADERRLHLIGPNQSGIKIPSWIKYHGSASPDEIRTKWFPFATGLVTLSQHSEGRPQVMLEAMASRLPVIASNIEAHADFIDHQSTGWLCNDKKSFESGVDQLSQFEYNRHIGIRASNSARNLSGNWDTYATRLLEIYQSISSQ